MRECVAGRPGVLLRLRSAAGGSFGDESGDALHRMRSGARERFAVLHTLRSAGWKHSTDQPTSQPSSQWTAVSQAPPTWSGNVPPPPVIQSGPLQTATPVKKRGNLVFKLAIAVVAILALGGVAVAGGIVYLGYVAKKRVAAAKQAYQKNDFEGMVAAVKGERVPAASKDAGAPGKSDDGKSDKKDLLGGLDIRGDRRRCKA